MISSGRMGRIGDWDFARGCGCEWDVFVFVGKVLVTVSWKEGIVAVWN